MVFAVNGESKSSRGCAKKAKGVTVECDMHQVRAILRAILKSTWLLKNVGHASGGRLCAGFKCLSFAQEDVYGYIFVDVSNIYLVLYPRISRSEKTVKKRQICLICHLEAPFCAFINDGMLLYGS